MPKEDEVADWQGQEWELYLENLPKSVEASQVRGGSNLVRVTHMFCFISDLLLFLFFFFAMISLCVYFSDQYNVVYYHWIVLGCF